MEERAKIKHKVSPRTFAGYINLKMYSEDGSGVASNFASFTPFLIFCGCIPVALTFHPNSYMRPLMECPCPRLQATTSPSGHHHELRPLLFLFGSRAGTGRDKRRAERPARSRFMSNQRRRHRKGGRSAGHPPSAPHPHAA
ncbi:hypothetical protein B0T11DRAFT_245531 [Plectosphaerella cucumerina]|uniref:Uncharacterized protein n=1 Tax=Plectosphaerella cucumerina TaxID=40658 RepID=A0A8K0X1S7_9PEZI|nr:hypothetical protein B0T11DRAFT_245531 [Plectosphaerella cucumerina]